MRLTEFWERMERVFGIGYARSVAADRVFATLGERTINQALGVGFSAKEVWRAVCQEAEVPAVER